MTSRPNPLDKGVQVFEEGLGFEEVFNKWKSEIERKGELEIIAREGNGGVVAITWKVYHRHSALEETVDMRPLQESADLDSGIGFDEDLTAPLTPEQREYLNHIAEAYLLLLKGHGFDCNLEPPSPDEPISLRRISVQVPERKDPLTVIMEIRKRDWAIALRGSFPRKHAYLKLTKCVGLHHRLS